MKVLDRSVITMMNLADRFMIEWRALSHQQSLLDRIDEKNNRLINLFEAKRQNDLDFLLMRYLPQMKQEIKNEILQSINTQVKVEGLDAIKTIDKELRKLGR